MHIATVVYCPKPEIKPLNQIKNLFQMLETKFSNGEALKKQKSAIYNP